MDWIGIFNGKRKRTGSQDRRTTRYEYEIGQCL